MERAIWDLCRRADSDLFEEVAAGIGHILGVVNELDAAMRKLLQTDDPTRPSMLGNYPARILETLAEEEAAKVLILLDAVRCPLAKKPERSRTLGYFYDHLAKGIYAEVCKWRLPASFEEIARYVEEQRVAYYLDGPNGVDWIFPNRIKQRREDGLYVGYVRDDSDKVGQGVCYWMRPFQSPIAFRFASPIIRVARALHDAGATTPGGLAVVKEVWRPVEMRPEMQSDEREQLNSRTLEMLKERGLLAVEAPEDHEVIMRHWPFPLWSLDLREWPRDKRKKEAAKLREARRTLSPDW